ncbi:MAG: hypothetical protein J6I68_04030 [Butyrivibrio sp.]|uniref:hypothetical protein n=1 Tax=Butyrivibrio sp. TaxID=28121 RepID=UPI001B658E52|nr:hypothetical protein [Butyrivibrio sp.]MBP3782396.1 hypothetical protein [Butyrivibrio sp.]
MDEIVRVIGVVFVLAFGISLHIGINKYLATIDSETKNRDYVFPFVLCGIFFVLVFVMAIINILSK